MFLKKLKIKSVKRILEFALQFLAAFLGSILTFHIWNYTNTNNYIVAQALILIASQTFPRHDDIFFGARLSGLTRLKFLPGTFFVFFIPIFVFLIFNLMKKVFVGFGGKYGFVAFTANVIVCCFCIPRKDYTYPLYDPNYYVALDIFIYIFGPLVSAGSASLGYIFYNYFKFRNKHAAVITDGLFLSLCFLTLTISPMLPNNTKFSLTYGEIFIQNAQIGVLTALTKEDFFKNYLIKNLMVPHYFLMGYIAGWIQIGTFGVFIVGGKVGVMAFLATNFYVRSIRHMFKIQETIQEQRKKQPRGSNVTSAGAVVFTVETERDFQKNNDKVADKNEKSENFSRIDELSEKEKNFRKIKIESAPIIPLQ